MTSTPQDSASAEATERTRLTGDAAGGPQVDSLRRGITWLIALTLIQKLVGLTRNVLFCRWLEPYQIGYWELAFSFLILASPLVVGGIPGAFGRYAEFFRQRGQLRRFVSRMTVVSVMLTLSAVALMLLFPRGLAWLVFEDSQLASMAVATVIGLIAVVAYNYVVILLESLRQPRLATISRFVHAILFSAAGLILLGGYRGGAVSIIWAYGFASLLTSLVVVLIVRQLFREAPGDTNRVAERDLWAKMAPAAGSIWLANLLTNFFSLIDRWMIVHFSGLPSQEAAGLVGQYHSSQALPLLLVGVVLSFNSMLAPYLSCDWEKGRGERSRRTLRLSLVSITLLAMVCGVGLLLAAPVLFDWLLQGRYDAGRNILPWAMLAAAWTCSHLVAQNYLWCVERPRWINASLVLGLVSNIVLNAILLPRWGLAGAAIATAFANMLALAALLWANHALAMRFDRSLAVVLLAPLTLACGALTATATLATLLYFECRWGGLLFHKNEAPWDRLTAWLSSRRFAPRTSSA